MASMGIHALVSLEDYKREIELRLRPVRIINQGQFLPYRLLELTSLYFCSIDTNYAYYLRVLIYSLSARLSSRNPFCTNFTFRVFERIGYCPSIFFSPSLPLLYGIYTSVRLYICTPFGSVLGRCPVALWVAIWQKNSNRYSYGNQIRGQSFFFCPSLQRIMVHMSRL